MTIFSKNNIHGVNWKGNTKAFERQISVFKKQFLEIEVFVWFILKIKDHSNH